jgi:hypothetical protein
MLLSVGIEGGSRGRHIETRKFKMEESFPRGKEFEMRNLFIGLMVAAGVLALSSGMLAQTPRQPGGAAKTPAAAGTPNLSGVWAIDRGGNVDYGEGRTREPLPMQPWTAKQYEYNRDPQAPNGNRGRIELDPRSHCFPPNPNFLMTYSDPFEILQSPERVLIVYEYDHWIRQIWINEQHPKDLSPSWMGHSVGKWDGDTLVVDTVGINGISWLDGAGHITTDALHLVERFRRANHDAIEYEVAFEDPKAYTKPWTEKRVYALKPDWKILERVFCEDRYQKGLYEIR